MSHVHTHTMIHAYFLTAVLVIAVNTEQKILQCNAHTHTHTHTNNTHTTHTHASTTKPTHPKKRLMDQVVPENCMECSKALKLISSIINRNKHACFTVSLPWRGDSLRVSHHLRGLTRFTVSLPWRGDSQRVSHYLRGINTLASRLLSLGEATV